jgi:hypothetical protein
LRPPRTLNSARLPAEFDCPITSNDAYPASLLPEKVEGDAVGQNARKQQTRCVTKAVLARERGASVKNIYPSEVVRFIDQVFPWAKPGRESVGRPELRLDQLSHVFGSLVELVQQIQPALLPADEKKWSRLLVATTQIKELIQAGRSGLVPYLPKETYGIGPRDPVSYIRGALADLPDQVIPKSTTGLTFLNDPEMAESLRADIATASSALRNGEWKAAAVLSGSVIEALLFWALQKTHTATIQAHAIGPKKSLEK